MEYLAFHLDTEICLFHFRTKDGAPEVMSLQKQATGLIGSQAHNDPSGFSLRKPGKLNSWFERDFEEQGEHH